MSGFWLGFFLVLLASFNFVRIFYPRWIPFLPEAKRLRHIDEIMKRLEQHEQGPQPGDFDVATKPIVSPQPVDEDDPPTWKVWNPRGDRLVLCTCHNRVFERGDKVLWWPIPNSGGAVDLFCEETASAVVQKES